MSEERTEAGKAYEEKMKARAEYYRERAAKAKADSDATYDKAHKMADMIPFGQPILVGHHSENADRNYRDRIGKTHEKATELAEKAKYYENKANNTDNPYAIRSDDPDATVKLKEKVLALEAQREKLKATDAKEVFKDLGHGFDPPYRKRLEIESLGRRIRDAKKRVDAILATRAIPATTETINGAQIVVDQEDNRVKMLFPSIPSQEIREKLKRNGWHWSHYNGAWQRQISNGALYSAREILKGMNTTEELFHVGKKGTLT